MRMRTSFVIVGIAIAVVACWPTSDLAPERTAARYEAELRRMEAEQVAHKRQIKLDDQAIRQAGDKFSSRPNARTERP